jgi:hypothetical protein
LPESVADARDASTEPESTPPPAKYGNDTEDVSAAEPTPAEKIVELVNAPEQANDGTIRGDEPHVHSTLAKVADNTDSHTTTAPGATNLPLPQGESLDDSPKSDKDVQHDTSYESRAAANLVDVRPEQSRVESDDKREDVVSAPTHSSSAAANLVDVQAEQQAEDEAEEKKAYPELVSADKVLAVPEEKEYVEDIVEAAALDTGKDDKPLLPASAETPVDAGSKGSVTSVHPEADEKDDDHDQYAKPAGANVDVEVIIPTTVHPDVLVDTRRAKRKDEDEDNS